MTRQSRIGTSLALVGATCFAALALLAPGATGAEAASGRDDCDLPAWRYVLTGHWGGDCG